MSLIRIKQLSQTTPRGMSLRAIDFEVAAGEVVGLLGSAHSGKSTLLRILATLEKPAQGDAWIAGHSVVSDGEAARHELGIVPKLVAVYDDMSVGDYLEFYALAHRIAPEDVDRAIERALSAAGYDAEATPEGGPFLASLSREKKQRLALAKADLHQPRVILVDSPGGGLDPGARLRVKEAVRALRTSERAILVASNVMADLAGLCDRLVLMAEGQILAMGTPAEMSERLAGSRILEMRLPAGVAPAEVVDRVMSVAGVAAAEAAPEVSDGKGRTLLVAIDLNLENPFDLIERLRAAGAPVEAFRELTIHIETLLDRSADEAQLRAAQ